MENGVGFGVAFLSCSFCIMRCYVEIWQGPDGEQELGGWDFQEGKVYCPGCVGITEELGAPMMPEDIDVRGIAVEVGDPAFFG